MDSIIFLVLLVSLLSLPLSLMSQPANPSSRITVVGVVYCDICASNSFSRHSYFLPGVDVHIQCKFKANSPKTAEEITFSVNRTTDKNGVYKMEIPHVDGVDCVDGMAIASLCQASLIGSSYSSCNVPGLRTTANEISVKSKEDNLCIYCLNALSYRPSKKNDTLCRNRKEQLPVAFFNSSKFFWPYFPPYGFPWPPLPSLPFPPLPPFPSFPFPSLPFPSPPSLPFPFPRLPPFPPRPPLFPPPPPPAFNLGDPSTWFPHFPSFPPPPPAFNLQDPGTWVPSFPPPPLQTQKP